MSFIELKNVYKTYRMGEVDVPVLKGVSLCIEKGEMVALMGSSGSGKSTMMNILGCLDRPTSGEYWFNGREVSGLLRDERATMRNGNMGFVFQSFNLLPRTTAIDNVRMPLTYSLISIPEKEECERAKKLLTRVGLGDRFDHHPSQLSGGQQQRVAIARALINHPPLLFADEPTGNLDSKTSDEVLKMFKELNQSEGITVVLVTHEMEIAQHAKRIIRLHDGRIEGEVR